MSASSDDLDQGRRHFLTLATGVAGGVGVIGAAIPFVSSFRPSARAQALGAPVEVDISKLEPGALIKVEWRGKPVYILNRSEEVLATLPDLDSVVRDPESEQQQQPDYARNPHRSVRPEVFVMIGVCTHLGCAPEYRPDVAPADLGPDWVGGFFCPCHGSKFDIAGRVYAGVPAPLNLVVPPHRFLSDTTLLIGDDRGIG
ncbi:MAG: ubiquinol-cytochrome c reductase iron-sulfur subunit [Gammaproteobacteria bacterium]|nr:ubiquinol-cytochrome c reductase iron-sulfur subunit [Gammaproteobacteria bacterium]NNF62457.1 ubiquinol-cytochrome c reductase iron-sulfur subunit [Gammaproteobacteria bacterium]NNM21809.1 ubiquinol-cytochrome c reductase iron-sulfur subunit [Gammaproteobacteria bacterium]